MQQEGGVSMGFMGDSMTELQDVKLINKKSKNWGKISGPKLDASELSIINRTLYSSPIPLIAKPTKMEWH